MYIVLYVVQARAEGLLPPKFDCQTDSGRPFQLVILVSVVLDEVLKADMFILVVDANVLVFGNYCVRVSGLRTF